MNDTVAIALKSPAHYCFGLFMDSSATVVIGRSVGLQIVHRVLPHGECSAVSVPRHLRPNGSSGDAACFESLFERLSVKISIELRFADSVQKDEP